MSLYSANGDGYWSVVDVSPVLRQIGHAHPGTFAG